MSPLNFEELEAKLKKTHGSHINENDVMSAALYPKVAADFFKFRAKYGPVVSYIFLRNDELSCVILMMNLHFIKK